MVAFVLMGVAVLAAWPTELRVTLVGGVPILAGLTVAYFVTRRMRRQNGEAPPLVTSSLSLSLPLRLVFAQTSGMALTKRQKQVYDFIADFVPRNGYSPPLE